MKIKTAFKITFFFVAFYFICFFTLNRLYGQNMFEVSSNEVIVTTQIDVDYYSRLTLIPTTVEIRQPSTAGIRVLTPNGTPRAGRTILFYIDGNSTGVTIVQPGPTNSFGEASGTISSSIPGSYLVCARDVTDGFDIMIQDCKTLYVTPVPPPVMLPEPEYTKGDSNTVMWNMSGPGVYEYYAQVSTDPDFSNITDSSGWIPNYSYEFTNLQSGQMYFYRVRARNAYGGVSAWSNVVFSVQVAEDPEVVFISISDIEDNTNINWERNFVITIKYRVTDNIGILDQDFWCVGSDGGRYECIFSATRDGDFWDISIELRHLEKTPNGNLFGEYRFCMEARNVVGNVTRNCEAVLVVTIEIPEEEIPEPIIPRVPIVTRIRERLERVVEDTLRDLREFDMTDITITTTAANLLVGFGLLLTMVGYLPYFLVQLGIAIMTLLGIRKKERVSGYVYNSLTKDPIGQAVVRVFNEVHELVWTSVTDSNGYFATTEVKDGEYYIKVVARGFDFPSKIVFGKKDFPLENVYHGDPFLTREERIPDFSIPMDPKDASEFRKRIAMIHSKGKVFWKILHVLLFIFGLLLSIYAAFVTPVWWNYLVLALYVPVLFALVYFQFGKKSKYGVVRDTNGKYVKGAIIGLTDKEFGRLVSKRVTDRLGRYKFVVGSGSYELSVLNSELKIDNEDDLSDLVVEEKSEVLAPNLRVRRLEDETDDDDLLEPLEEL